MKKHQSFSVSVHENTRRFSKFAVLPAALAVKHRQRAGEVEQSVSFAGGRIMVGHVVSEMCKGYK